MARLKEIYVDFFNTVQEQGGIPKGTTIVQVDYYRLIGRESEAEKEDLREIFVDLLNKGDAIMLRIFADAPVGGLCTILKLIMAITGERVVVLQAKDGNIEAVDYTLNFLNP
ncbi:MAG: hypothetical protein ACRCYY_04925 [Trueperaceae bacterium]